MLIVELLKELANEDKVDVVVAPPYLSISAVVELNKELHSRLGERILDIWFAGLRNARLAVARSPFGSSGHIAVDLMLERPSQERILTLSRVQVMPDSGKPLTFEILFSYRMGTC